MLKVLKNPTILSNGKENDDFQTLLRVEYHCHDLTWRDTLTQCRTYVEEISCWKKTKKKSGKHNTLNGALNETGTNAETGAIKQRVLARGWRVLSQGYRGTCWNACEQVYWCPVSHVNEIISARLLDVGVSIGLGARKKKKVSTVCLANLSHSRWLPWFNWVNKRGWKLPFEITSATSFGPFIQTERAREPRETKSLCVTRTSAKHLCAALLNLQQKQCQILKGHFLKGHIPFYCWFYWDRWDFGWRLWRWNNLYILIVQNKDKFTSIFYFLSLIHFEKTYVVVVLKKKKKTSTFVMS